MGTPSPLFHPAPVLAERLSALLHSVGRRMAAFRLQVRQFRDLAHQITSSDLSGAAA